MSTSAVSDESTVVAGVDLVDPELAATVRDGLAAVEKLLVDELSDGEEFLQEAALHLARAGGKRFRPLFTVRSGQLGPNPTDPALVTAGTDVERVPLAPREHHDRLAVS
ncbi:polyprenyl synthetase family protein, partial [Nocardia sp. NPDC058497]